MNNGFSIVKGQFYEINFRKILTFNIIKQFEQYDCITY